MSIGVRRMKKRRTLDSNYLAAISVRVIELSEDRFHLFGQIAGRGQLVSHFAVPALTAENVD
jgi:hypothetical protein